MKRWSIQFRKARNLENVFCQIDFVWRTDGEMETSSGTQINKKFVCFQNTVPIYHRYDA